MPLVYEVTEVKAARLPKDLLFVAALGTTRTSGWTGAQLAPRFYISPPADGIWDFDFVADAPNGPVLQWIAPVAASHTGAAASWVRGVRVHSETNSTETELLTGREKVDTVDAAGALFQSNRSAAIVQRTLAVYDDSHQPVGMCSLVSIRMKKLRHELIVTVEGPDQAHANRCMNEALQAGVMAGIVAAFASGGWAAAQAFVGAAMATLMACLGDGYSARFDDRSHWIEWCT